MKCDMSIIVEGPNEHGMFKRRCSRPGCTKKTNWTPDTPDRIYFACLAWPRSWEWGTWLSIGLSVFFITKEHVGWIKHKLGLQEPGPCKTCPLYEAWLNTLGGRLVTAAEDGKWYGSLARLLVTRAKEPPSP